MRVAIIGWYGHQNAGDDRILYCFQRFFSEDEILPINGFAGMKERWEEINSCDFVMFGGGGMVLRRTGKHARLFAELRPPMACVGISVEAVHSDNRQLIEVLKEKAEFILVRDSASLQAFDFHPKAVAGPDLTFLEPFEIAPVSADDRCGVNFLPWKYWKGEHNGRFDLVMRKLNRRFPFTKNVYPLSKWEPFKAIQVLRDHFQTLTPVCLYNEPNRVTDAAQLREFFAKIEEDFSPRQISDCRMIVSMRLHALIFACQMGVPFVSLSYMPKNHEFCKSLGLEGNSVNLFDLRQLDKAVRRVRESFDETRQNLLDRRSKNHKEITRLMRELMWRTNSVKCIPKKSTPARLTREVERMPPTS